MVLANQRLARKRKKSKNNDFVVQLISCSLKTSFFNFSWDIRNKAGSQSRFNDFIDFFRQRRVRLWRKLSHVGMPRIELGTSSLSVTRSNHLSYMPVVSLKSP